MSTPPPDLDLHRPFRVGPWTVFPTRHELQRAGVAPVRVEPKVMDLLVALAQQAGTTQSRDALLAAVWPEVVVSDDALNRAVSKLRQALGDTPQTPRYIETIPKQGYRLVAPVAPMAPASPPQPRASLALPTPRPHWWMWVAGLGVLILAALAWWLVREAASPVAYVHHPATRMAGTERHPALAPDGRVAFSARTREEDAYRLFVQPADAATAVPLTATDANDLFPTWAPDGQSLVFLRCTTEACHPYRIAAVGGPATRLSASAFAPYGLAHHPTDAVLLGVRRETPTAPYRIYALDLTTDTLTPLTTPGAPIIGDLFPTMRRDGMALAFVRHGANGVETLYSTDLRPDTPLTTWGSYPARVGGLDWQDDALVFTASTKTQRTPSVWHQATPSDAPALRFTAACCLGRLSVAGTTLVVEQWTEETNLWSMTPTGAHSPLLASTALDSQPTLSPDGTRVAFISTRTGHAELWVADREQPHRLRQLTTAEARVGAPDWSPDGEHIAFEIEQEGTSELYLIHAEGGPLQQLTTTGAYTHSPRWTPDGQHLTFSSDASGAWGIWEYAMATGAVTYLAEGFFGQRHTDGALYLTRYPEAGLWRMGTRDDAPHRLVDDLHPLDWGSWALHGNTLTYLARTDTSASLMQHALRTGISVRRAALPADLPRREPALAVAPDGHVIIARQERRESDLIRLTPRPR